MFNSSVDHVTYGLNFVSRKKEKKRGGHIIMSHQFDPIPRKQPLLIYIHHYDYKWLVSLALCVENMAQGHTVLVCGRFISNTFYGFACA